MADRSRSKQSPEAQAYLAAIVESSDDAIISKDLQGTITSWNRAAERIFGYSAQEAIGQSILMLIPPERASEETEILSKIRRGERIEHFETVRVRKDGQTIPISATISPIKDSRGKIVGASKIGRDISDRILAEERVHKERERLRVTLASIGDAVIVTNAEAQVRFLNPVAESLTGWTQQEAEGQPLEAVFKIIHETTRRPAENPAQRALREGLVVGLANHTVLIRRDGAERAIDDSAAPIRGKAGEVLGVILVFRDVTERRQWERDLSQLAAIIEGSEDAIISKDLQGVITSWNRGAERIFGYREKEVIGRPITLLIPPDRLDEESQILERLKRGERVDHFETVRVAKGGRKIHISLTISPIKDADGNVAGASKIGRDISERILAAERLHADRERLRVTLSSIGDAVIVTDADARINFLNPVAESLTGWTQQDAEEQPLDIVFKIVNETTRRAAANPAHRALREGIVVGLANHTVLIRRDGTERAIDDSAAPIRGKGGEVLGVILVFRDVTERRMWERDLAQLAAIIESSDDAIISKGLDGVIRSWNHGAERIFGYGAKEAIGKPITILIPPDRLDEEPKILERLKRGERVDHFETVRVAKDGRKIDISLTISPIKDSEGGVVGASKIARDITETKRAAGALKQAEQTLADYARNLEQKVAERTFALREIVQDLETFSYSISHDLRAPLRAMQGFSNLLAQDHAQELSPQAAEYVRRIGQSAVRMDKLIRDVLDYSRITRTQLDIYPLEVEPLLRGVIESYPMLQAQNAQISINGPFPDALGNEAGLTQCFSNLLGNAVKFVAPDVSPRVRVWAETHGNRVRLLFEDNGIGIEKEAQERIFGIFERLNSEYQGTGIGLAIVKKAAEKMGGTVGVDSEPGKGSRFWIELQRVRPQAKQRK